MQSDSVVIDSRALNRYAIGGEFPVAYRLARRNGELVLQGLWREIEWEYGRPMQRQNSTMAHMWIADPTKPGIIDRLFSTHPPLADRVTRLGEMGGSF